MPTFNVLFDQFGGKWDGQQVSSAGGGFSDREQMKVAEAVRDAAAFSALAKAAAGTQFPGKRHLLKTWFGSDDPATIRAAQAGIDRMHAVLVDASRTVRFVDARRQSEKLYVGDTSLAPTVVPMTASDYAYVKCLADHGPPGKQAHAGSGMRVYLGERMFHHSKQLVDRSLTVYHELTHKVLGTVDFGTYGPGPSRALAANSTERALRHAECWTYFAASFNPKYRF